MEKQNVLLLDELQLKVKFQIIQEKMDLDMIQDPEQLGVYSKDYYARLVSALALTFVTVEKVLGWDAFFALAKNFIRKHPSTSYNINHFGERFPKFLSSSDFIKNKPFLPDLAQLEWSIDESFHALDQRSFDPNTKANLDPSLWENAILKFQPSVKLLTSPWSFWNFWRNRKNKNFDFQTTPVKQKTTYILIYRTQDQVFSQTIDELEHQTLSSLLLGQPLGKVCESLAPLDQNLPITDWFAKWSSFGMIRDCTFN